MRGIQSPLMVEHLLQLCLGCGSPTVKKQHRVLTNKGDRDKVKSLLRRYYGALLEERKLRLVNSDVYEMLTAADGSKSRNCTTNVYLSENCWNCLSVPFIKRKIHSAKNF